MAINYDLTQRGQEVQEALDMVPDTISKKNGIDEEDLTAQNGKLRFKDKEFNASVFSGLGRKYLKKNIDTNGLSTKNILTQAMLDKANTIYHIQYDYDLDGGTVEVPGGCVLKFEGGSLRNGSLVLDSTLIDADDYSVIFHDVTLYGTLRGERLSVCNFGVLPSTDAIQYASTNAEILNTFVKDFASNTGAGVYIPKSEKGYYYFNNPVCFVGNHNVVCDGVLYYTGELNSAALTINNNPDGIVSLKTYIIKITKDAITSDIVSGFDVVEDETVYPDNVGVLIRNAYHCNIDIKYASNFLYCARLLAGSGSNGCVYNTVRLGLIGVGSHVSGLHLKAEGNGWCNENVFIGGRFQHSGNAIAKQVAIWIEGSSTHGANNNVFIKPSLESHEVGVRYTYAGSNSFFGARLEGVGVAIESDLESQNNTLLYGYPQQLAGTSFPNYHKNNTVMNLTNLSQGMFRDIFKDVALSFKVGSVVTSNMSLMADNALVESYNGSPLFGVVIKFSYDGYKHLKIFQSKVPSSSNNRLRIYILDSEDNYSTISVTNETVYDYMLYGSTFYKSTNGGYLVQSTNVTSGAVTFTPTVTAVFIGTPVEGNCINVRSNLGVASREIVYPLGNNISSGIPTYASALTPIGHTIYDSLNDKFLTFNGEEFESSNIFDKELDAYTKTKIDSNYLQQDHVIIDGRLDSYIKTKIDGAETSKTVTSSVMTFIGSNGPLLRESTNVLSRGVGILLPYMEGDVLTLRVTEAHRFFVAYYNGSTFVETTNSTLPIKLSGTNYSRTRITSNGPYMATTGSDSTVSKIMIPRLEGVTKILIGVRGGDLTNSLRVTSSKNTEAETLSVRNIGTTLERPSIVYDGFEYYDIDLGQMIQWSSADGGNWVE